MMVYEIKPLETETANAYQFFSYI